ncbi:LOW QUALITY PROTEIN: receptor-like protein kinase HERK 1 [Dioscorea cayenensis subsp. rotundata]|uniref:LOW QUALITY PROTEIN: receptor-like protein kinase HERK 1 n=1 Tax=Dioscorea cayennensis subsp. rotundata TaxID=55577 RepID=A0AB40D3L3_DIOCR|nr:LOW QUALITY PROTEIN: receptor-like protein kinase HERK 1 [Dioscorea cayenensis subsp. rotundata]
MESPLIFLTIISISMFSLSAFTPTTTYFLNCGASTNTTFLHDNPSRIFTPDSPFLSSSSSSILTNPSSSSSSSSSSSITNATDSLYATARLFNQTSSYTFKTNSSGTHVLRLHFSPFSTPTHNLSSTNFSVYALQTILLLSSFSPSNTTIMEYFLWLSSTDITFTLTFTPLSFISAIELFTAPPSLFNKHTKPRQVSPPAYNTSIGDFTHQTWQTLYRVNVGGPLITPANDTLWRTWTPDDAFLFSNLTSTEVNTSSNDSLHIDPWNTPDVAPPFVLNTARESADIDVNVTWSFSVAPGYKYFVRIHLCDFISNNSLDYLFDIYIGELFAYQDLQLGSLTNYTPAAAYHLDFIADDVWPFGLLNVTVGPSSNINNTGHANAFMNGLEILKLINSDADSPGKGSRRAHLLIIACSAVAALALIIFFIFLNFIIKRKKQELVPQQEKKAANTSLVTPKIVNINLELCIPLSDIKLATNDFDEALVIGHGGFGKVYKGVLSDGTMVAVKRGMGRSRQGYPEFVNEINLLSKIRHRHLVSIIGYCDEMDEMIIVYEFLENGTLKNYLYGSPDLPCLSWKQRLQVCIGAARGLDYLHTAHSPVIIHRDVKSTNILLGQDFLAKISDFGISKLGPLLGEDTYVSTGVKGSFGYFDPEYFRMLRLTTKSDVYSFGVVLFEVLSARPVIDPWFKDDELNLADCALDCMKTGELDKIIDVRIAEEINPKSLEKFAEIAEQCLAACGDDRPTIGDVLWNLEYALQLQVTELRREPYEDSGTVDPHLRSLALVRRLPSTITKIEDDDADLIGIMEFNDSTYREVASQQ